MASSSDFSSMVGCAYELRRTVTLGRASRRRNAIESLLRALVAFLFLCSLADSAFSWSGSAAGRFETPYMGRGSPVLAPELGAVAEPESQQAETQFVIDRQSEEPSGGSPDVLARWRATDQEPDAEFTQWLEGVDNDRVDSNMARGWLIENGRPIGRRGTHQLLFLFCKGKDRKDQVLLNRRGQEGISLGSYVRSRVGIWEIKELDTRDAVDLILVSCQQHLSGD